MNKSSYNPLLQKEKLKMLEIARKSLSMQLHGIPQTDWKREADQMPVLHSQRGIFVSFHRGGELRGCIGRIRSQLPLYLGIPKQTIIAASRDNRFSPILREELPSLDIELSILGYLEKLDNPMDFKIGIHGVYIEGQNGCGTLLPQVAESEGWNKLEFLGHCSKYKASMGWEGWKLATVYRYTAEVFSEKEILS